jgi:hypothetical protein
VKNRFLLFAVLAYCGAASAQDYPNKPIRIVVRENPVVVGIATREDGRSRGATLGLNRESVRETRPFLDEPAGRRRHDVQGVEALVVGNDDEDVRTARGHVRHESHTFENGSPSVTRYRKRRAATRSKVFAGWICQPSSQRKKSSRARRFSGEQ